MALPGAVSADSFDGGTDTTPSDGVITGCYKPAPGHGDDEDGEGGARSTPLRVVESADECKRNEVALAWNQQGPQGEPGADGANGVNCWDLDGDGVADSKEDANNDGIVDVLDCQGPPGPTGPEGAPGANGADGADGLNCWDSNANGDADASDDVNDDGAVDALDCQGPQGPAGEVGEPGPAGPSGADGTHCWDLNGNGEGDLADEDVNGDGTVDVADCSGSTDLSVYTRTKSRWLDESNGYGGSVMAQCDAGDLRTGGGYSLSLSINNREIATRIDHTKPVSGGWSVQARVAANVEAGLTVYVVCLST